MTDTPTENPDRAGTQPFDRTNVAKPAGERSSIEREADAATAEGASGALRRGEEAVAASAPNGASDAELDRSGAGRENSDG